MGDCSAQVTAAEGGAASGVQRYSAFGEVRSRGGEMPTVYQYTGQLSQMEEVGLYHYGARWFDPAGAHFTQADTLIPGVGNPLSWDRYAYVNYSPLVYVDPTGHKACSSDGDSFDTCTDPLGITSQEFAQNFNITFEGAWEESKQWSVLVAAAMVGARFGTVLGMDAARAFIRVYALNDGKQFTFGWGSCSECKGSGGYTYNSTTIRFESLWTWHPDNRIPNVIHELGHAFNNLFWTSLSTGGRARLPEALFSDSQKSISNFPDRDSTDPNYGYGGPFGFWQQSKETTPSEEFADNFIGWTFNYWERNEAGNMRANWMNTFMPVFVNMAASW